jgi:hypothetical protein
MTSPVVPRSWRTPFWDGLAGAKLPLPLLPVLRPHWSCQALPNGDKQFVDYAGANRAGDRRLTHTMDGAVVNRWTIYSRDRVPSALPSLEPALTWALAGGIPFAPRWRDLMSAANYSITSSDLRLFLRPT